MLSIHLSEFGNPLEKVSYTETCRNLRVSLCCDLGIYVSNLLSLTVLARVFPHLSLDSYVVRRHFGSVSEEVIDLGTKGGKFSV